MTLTDICKDIYVINLLRRTDRYEKVQEQAKRFGFPFVITSAVDAREINNPTKLRDGEYALLLSHAKVVNWAISRKLQSVLILEDDFECVENFNERLIEFSEVPNDWDAVYFGGNHSHFGAGSVSPEKITEKISRLRCTYTTHAILLKESLYEPVLNSIKDFNKPLDLIYVDLQKNYNIYGFSKNLCKQYDSESDIIGFNPGYNSMGVFD